MIPQPHPCLPYLCNTSSYMQLNWCGITYCENILVMPKLLSERNIPSQLYAWFDLLKIFGCEMHAFQTLSRGGKNKAKLVSTTFPASGCRYLLIGHLNKLHAEGSVDTPISFYFHFGWFRIVRMESLTIKNVLCFMALICPAISKHYEKCELASELIKLGLPQDQLNDCKLISKTVIIRYAINL